jgi:hypothetical protein
MVDLIIREDLTVVTTILVLVEAVEFYQTLPCPVTHLGKEVVEEEEQEVGSGEAVTAEDGSVTEDVNTVEA